MPGAISTFAKALALALVPMSVQAAPPAGAAPGTGTEPRSGSGSAPARSPLTVVTLPVEVEGELGEEWIRQLDGGVADGLARGNFEVVVGTGPCPDRACWTKTAKTHKARYLVRPVVTAAERNRNYAVALTLIDGRSGETVAEATDQCELCGMQEVRGLVADQAAALRTKLDALVSEPPMVLVESTPSEAVIRIDGEPVGTTPLSWELTPGPHVARAEKDGYVVVERQFTAVAGVEETLQLTLEPLPDLGPRVRPWGFLGIALGGASLAAGVTFLVLDERPAPADRCAGDNVDAAGNCRYRWDSLGPGLIFTVSGVAVSIIGTAVLVVTRPRRQQRRRARRSASLLPAPAGISVQF